MSDAAIDAKKGPRYLLAGGIVCAAALSIALFFIGARFPFGRGPLLFSPDELVQSTWINYKKTYVSSSYRTIDPGRGGITTSEGQGYTMLRAVWLGDEATFDGAWGWTRANLARPGDHLFAWLYGPLPGGGYGVRTDENGQHTASDADTNIALALVFAYARWQDPHHLDDARAIINDIWDKEVVEIQGRPYLAADDIEKGASTPWIVVNPSYLSPAAYHIFAAVDPGHPWEELRTQSYVLLRQSADAVIDGQASAHLPPHWIRVSRATGAIVASSTASYDTDFSFDAMRVPFNVELDALWFGNHSASELLSDFSFLSERWREDGRLVSSYAHTGAASSSAEAVSIYGGTLGYFMSADPTRARAIFERKLLPLYDPSSGAWSPTLSYYDDNWAWFGVALYTGELPNLAAGLPASAFSQ